MYSIRLELGREEEDRRFTEYIRQIEEEEKINERKTRKRQWYAKRIAFVCVCLLFFLASVAMLIVDINKYKELKALIEEINNRPVYSEAHPVIDASIREQIEEEKRIEEEKKNMQYSAVEAENMIDLGEDVLGEFVIVVDANNDTIVASRNGRSRMVPASMTKVLTLLVAAEHITEEQLDDDFVITPEIISYTYNHGCSAVGFLENETVKVRDLLYGTILPSGGDAAVGLATYVAGSQVEFVDMMNEKLKTLGLSETAHFTNCVGLYDDNHYCSCYDMAMIMRAAIENPLCKEILSTRIYTTTPTPEHTNGIEISNWFLRRIEDKPCGGTVTCGKTGYVKQSGNCAASYATNDKGLDYIVIIGNAPGSWKCIYDHVKIYRKLFPDYDEKDVNQEQEEAEFAGEVHDH